MPWLLLLKNNWRLLLAVAIFVAGWHSHVVYSGYKEQKKSAAVIKKLGEGQNEIIKFNADFDKGLMNVKDDCVSKPIPAPIRVLLSKPGVS